MQKAHLRCRKTGTWSTIRLRLQGAGTLQGAQSCHITLRDLQLYAEIRGSSQFEAPSGLMIVTPELPITSDSELQALRNVLNTDGINEVISKVTAHKLEANIADLVNLDPISTSHTANTSWTAPLLVTTSVILILVVVYYCTYTRQGIVKMLCQGVTRSSP